MNSKHHTFDTGFWAKPLEKLQRENQQRRNFVKELTENFWVYNNYNFQQLMLSTYLENQATFTLDFHAVWLPFSQLYGPGKTHCTV